MQKSLDHLYDLYGGIRDGSIDTGLLDAIWVECYGSKTLLKHLCLVTIRGNALVVWPHDPGIIASVEKAIQKCGLGLNPQRAATSILVNIPRLYTDQRQKLVKHTKRIAEETKVSMRNIRRRARKAGIPSKEINKLTEEFVGYVDDALGRKEKTIRGER